jgi:hypothetical protein
MFKAFLLRWGNIPSMSPQNSMYNLLRNWTFKKCQIIDFFFFTRKIVILGSISMEWIRNPFLFITYCFWKILRKPWLQINQVIFDTLINSSVTRFHTVFLNKIPQTGRHVQTFPSQFSDPQAQLPNKCLHFITHYNHVSIVALHACVSERWTSKKYHSSMLT